MTCKEMKANEPTHEKTDLSAPGLISFKPTCEPAHEKMCLISYANNKGADQPAHPRSLISAFIVRCLDSVMSLSFCIQNFKPHASFCS